MPLVMNHKTAWCEALDKALPHLQNISVPINVKGVHLLTLLMRVAGTNSGQCASKLPAAYRG